MLSQDARSPLFSPKKIRDLDKTIVGAEDILLPVNLKNPIYLAILDRNFLELRRIFAAVKPHHEKICMKRLVDQCLSEPIVFYNFSVDEFQQLIEILKTVAPEVQEANYVAGYSVLGIGGESSYQYKTLLEQAVFQGNLSLTKYLIKNGANFNEEVKDSFLQDLRETIQSTVESLDSYKSTENLSFSQEMDQATLKRCKELIEYLEHTDACPKMVPTFSART